jgi:PEGA domain
MEFLTTKQKKKKARQLFIGYGLLSVLIALASYVMISTALGYEILSTKGEVVHNGLLFVSSKPDAAEVYLNGKLESGKTNAKYSIPEDTYEILLKKEGFQDYTSSLSLIGGTVEFITYPRLYPTSPSILLSMQQAGLTLTEQSRDKRWVVSHSKSEPSLFRVIDLQNPKNQARIVTIPTSLHADTTIETVTIIEWAGDNEHFLAKLHLADQKFKYVLFSRDNPENIVDVSEVLALEQTDAIGLWEAKKDSVYIRKSNGVVRLGSLKDKSTDASAMISDETMQFMPFGNKRAVFSVASGDDTILKYYAEGKVYTILNLKSSDRPVTAKIFGFNRNEYMLIAGGSLEKTYLYKNFEKAVKDSSSSHATPYFIMPKPSNNIDVSRGNRFVMGARAEKL